MREQILCVGAPEPERQTQLRSNLQHTVRTEPRLGHLTQAIHNLHQSKTMKKLLTLTLGLACALVANTVHAAGPTFVCRIKIH